MTSSRYSPARTAAATTPFDQDERLRWVERVSRLLDSQFSVPGTGWRFGLDPLMSFIPIIGGIPSLAVSGVLILTMMRHGASGNVVVRMVLNVLLDTLVGAIPVLGTIFDFAYKANDRNVRLLRAHYQEGKYQGSGKGLIALIIIILVVFGGLVLWGSFELFRAIYHYIQNS
ncbi:DUF4112 domain-containing protein [Hymenobacter yonginensis]|uniref:DUF4112 domain-containing protein n=1 Tax=Hymenobacter yonginensis TaxID=748197 RepID=A0ABY7PU11_9BACT|nr:DUF4112 domain-containing protein [Hymenobacter yonginensis]WBO86395.1 DUF4112 domain-containing protein [Hymenobacter yonginensis]